MTDDTSSAKFKAREPNRVLQASMYTLALGAGLGTAGFKIWDEHYRKMKQTDTVKEMSKNRYEEINDLLKGQDLSNKEYAEKVATIEKNYTEKYNTFLKTQIGIETEGNLGKKLKGTLQRFEALGPFKKGNIVFTGAVAMGTTIGAYILLNQNVLLKKDLKDLHAKLDEQQSTTSR